MDVESGPLGSRFGYVSVASNTVVLFFGITVERDKFDITPNNNGILAKNSASELLIDRLYAYRPLNVLLFCAA